MLMMPTTKGKPQMIKLLNAYAASRSTKAAQKVRAYERAHPMSRCMLSPLYQDYLAEAIHQANKEG
jgi:hypothetical protein